MREVGIMGEPGSRGGEERSKERERVGKRTQKGRPVEVGRGKFCLKLSNF